jgi:hypothetical protein
MIGDIDLIFGMRVYNHKLQINFGSTSTSYDAPSTVTTMHRREQTIYLQLINKQKQKTKK